ncbi:MAG: DUF4491 family protein [Clostridiales bacterium]|nr:DUF4491 family protein [Clostridiales bacterium]
MNIHGLAIGIATFLIIGLFHPIVIKTEYYIGKKIWPLFLILGLLCIYLSTLISNLIASSIIGITGFTLLWSIQELIEQENRVKKGWFPANPKKAQSKKYEKKYS